MWLWRKLQHLIKTSLRLLGLQAAFTFMNNHYYALFDLPLQFEINEEALGTNYRKLAAACHPDKVASKSDFEQKESLMMASTVNEAYRILKHPLDRAAYLLKLQNIDADDATHTQFSSEFLMQQMEWREILEIAIQNQDSTMLLNLNEEINLAYQDLLKSIATLFNDQADPQEIAQQVRQGRFLDKLQIQLNEALEQLLG